MTTSAPAVVLLHGQPGSALIWTRVEPLLRDHGLQPVAIDRPGYGHAPGRALDQFGNATTIARLLDERQIRPAVVVGHSLGAGIALALATAAPRHVRALVLVAPAVGTAAVTPSDRALAAPVVGPTLSWLGFRAAGLAFRARALRRRVLVDRFGLDGRDADEVALRLRRSPIWRSFADEQRHFVREAALVQRELPRIGCPVVILSGTRDRMVGPGVVAALARALPDPDLITTATGHLIPVDDPGAVMTAVLRALRRQYRRSTVPYVRARPS